MFASHSKLLIAACLLILPAGAPGALPVAEPEAPASASAGAALPPEGCVRLVRGYRIAMSLGRHEEALALLRQARERYPDEVLPLLHLADYVEEVGLSEEGQEELQSALRLYFLGEKPFPLPLALRTIETVDASEEELEMARRSLEGEIARGEAAVRLDPRLLDALAQVQLRLDDLEGARGSLVRLLEMRPEAYLRWSLAQLEMELGEWGSAVSHLQALRDHELFGVSARMDLVVAYAHLGRFEELQSEARQVIAEARKHLLSMHELADKQREPAVAALFRDETPFIRALLDSAWAFRDRGEHEEARAVFELVRELSPDQEEAGGALLVLYGTAEERAEHARRREAAWKEKTNEWSLLEEGAKRLAAGDAQGAYELLERASRELEDSELLWYNLGLAALRLERWEETASAMEKALALNPGRPETVVSLATAYERLDRCPEAIALLEELRIEHPESYRADYYLYVCYVELGQREKAEEALSRYHRKRPGGP